MSKTQIVVVPGAWHGPCYMESVASKLEALGYTVQCQQMPAVGSSDSPRDLSADIAALRSMVEKAIDTDRDVVVVCHSWGGTVTSNGLVGLSATERQHQGQKGGVDKFCYAVDPHILYNDLPVDEQRFWFAKLQSHVYATLHDKATAATWKTIPTSYLLCEEDAALVPAAQQAFIHAARDKGADVDVTRIKAGHSPFLSKVDETVEWIVGVAGRAK
ncbi:hypothetical protein ACEQ8H_000569 [Pleosporales sp. CAS-2024a]